MANTTRIFNGFTVEVGPGDNGIDCQITKGKFSSSLACAEDQGALDHFESGDQLAIPTATLAAIRDFAERLGY